MADTTKLGPFTGVNNRKQRHALRDEATKTNALLSAENVVVDITGRLQRRAGYTRETVLTSGDSLWCDGANMYYRNNGSLYRDGVVLESVAGRCTYDMFPGGGVVYSDGASLRYIDSSGVTSRLAPSQPAEIEVSATTGDLQAGVYLVAATGVDANGVEGPATAVYELELASTGGISITLPALATGTATHNVYVSGPNGEVPALHGSTDEGTYTITTYAQYRALTTAGMLNMPPGSIARVFNGRLLVTVGRVLYVSEAYNYGVYDPSIGFFVFPKSITIVAPVENGVYVAADKTYWLSGTDIRASELVEVLPYGAVAGSDALSDTRKEAAWMSRKGVVVGSKDGTVINLQDRDLAINESGTRGATIYISDEARIISVTNG